MTSVLVAFGSRHGGTRGIAERIGEVLAARGIGAVVMPADEVALTDILDGDAFVVGSGVYMGSWLGEPLRFLEHHARSLASRPVWLFSSGPLPGSTKSTTGTDPLTEALGPEEGPGSGGRKKVAALAERIHARDHRVFLGRFDPTDAPRGIAERVVRMLPVAKGVLPEGDFRNWDDIEAWATTIATELRAPTAATV